MSQKKKKLLICYYAIIGYSSEIFLNLYINLFFISDYSYPFITVVLSVISNAAHFALRENQTWKALFLDTITDIRNCVILLGHWCLHAYGIIAITTYKKILPNPTHLLFLVPFPAIFYISTAIFTDPNKVIP